MFSCEDVCESYNYVLTKVSITLYLHKNDCTLRSGRRGRQFESLLLIMIKLVKRFSADTLTSITDYQRDNLHHICSAVY